MLNRLRERFVGDTAVAVVEHNLDAPLPRSLGTFDAIVSSFAIHHLTHDRKRQLFGEVFVALSPPGVFANLEHVDSPSAALHDEFLAAIGIERADEDPSNKLLNMQQQLEWLRSVGFEDVDCQWKWRELALLVGRRAKHEGR
jgi:hypothetical protein